MKTKHRSLFAAAPALLAGCLMAGLFSPAFTCQGQTAQNLGTAVSPAPPPGQIWVYPTGVFPDDFYALWLAVNGAPYASGDLPVPYYSVPDTQPGARPVFVGNALPSGNWTVVLKARHLNATGDGAYVEGPFTAFNLGLAAGTQLINRDPVPPVLYMLTTDENRFSTGFGLVMLKRSVAIQGEKIPGGQERFFGYTPNFDPAASPDTNPDFNADWLPATYPRGSEFVPGQGYGVWSAKPVVYGGNMAFFIYNVNADLSLSDCLLYGQYGSGIADYTGPNQLQVRNVHIIHTYHHHQQGYKNNVGMLTWAILIQNMLGGSGGHRSIEGCYIDQSPTWQEYYFGANPNQRRYTVDAFPGGHAIYIAYQSKANSDDYVRIEDSTMKNCGSNVAVYDTSDVDLLIKNCVMDGGFFSIAPTKNSDFVNWRGNCINIYGPSVDAWGSSPVIEITDNELIARGLDAWGVKLYGCANGEATIADNTIVCAEAGPNYAGGVYLQPYWTAGCNRNKVLRNTILGTGSWAIQIYAPAVVPCEENVFIDNDLADFSTQQAGAVYFGPLANNNLFIGDVGAGIVDLGTGNEVE